MSLTLNQFSGTYLESYSSGTLLGSVVTATNNGKDQRSGNGASSTTQLSDSTHLSPIAQLLSRLQHLQQSNPTQYGIVTQEIAANLQAAAQTAQAQGDSSTANQLSQLSNDFSNASQNGQLPDIQDLAQALTGSSNLPSHRLNVQDDPVLTNTAALGNTASVGTGSTSVSSTSRMIQSLFSVFQSKPNQNQGQSQSLNPVLIIMNALSSVSTERLSAKARTA